MPSAFDILGVLSFAQGVITLLAAGILAFHAWTEQVGVEVKHSTCADVSAQTAGA
jgi:S-adenosylmethionine/arginine decarboxylase-like enzyme